MQFLMKNTCPSLTAHLSKSSLPKSFLPMLYFGHYLLAYLNPT
jgi:hypothetical protein